MRTLAQTSVHVPGACTEPESTNPRQPHVETRVCSRSWIRATQKPSETSSADTETC
ncbi:Hypothetical predicted protein [Marmota monax]|uniref:Uncharacterized protein n=1 Tax=Marmota monax TaxID=9995 RepID=A0A5E4BLU8_MARMO|nr:hypothetical protein GHT09_005875 [Marmota monax]VTJ70643.1 Hypothetical predicted protein [Marmota monax]VTJ92236.1 Hypothetical predicted protein [Marmota monax]